MNVRHAQASDLPVIVDMFVALADFIRSKNPEANITDDRDKLIGGALLVLRGKMLTAGHCVIVMENDEGVKGFCAGSLTQMPPFAKYEIVGELNWLYPMAPVSRVLLKAFDKWAIDGGATARWGFAASGNELSQRVMEHEGMHLEILQYFKEYHKEADSVLR